MVIENLKLKYQIATIATMATVKNGGMITC
jgi:hypothetical protein